MIDKKNLNRLFLICVTEKINELPIKHKKPLTINPLKPGHCICEQTNHITAQLIIVKIVHPIHQPKYFQTLWQAK